MNQNTSSAELEKLVDHGLSNGNGTELAWYEAVQQKDFSLALTHIEEDLAQSPHCPGTRLWWVRCQLELGRVPITALTAPLDEILEELKEIPSLFAFSCSTFLKTAINLFERNQSRLAVSMLERAVEFARISKSISDSQKQLLEDYFIECLREEIDRAQLRRGSKRYLETLRQKLEAQEKEKPKRKASSKSEKSSRKKQKKYLSSKSILSAAASSANKEKKQTEELSEQAHTETSAEDQNAEDELLPTVDSVDKGNRSSSAAKYLFMMLLLVVLAVLGASWQLLLRPQIGEKIRSQLAMQVHVPRNTQLEMPTSEPPTKEAGKSGALSKTLDEVGKRLKKLGLNDPDNADSQPKGKKKQNSSEVDHDALNPANAKSLARASSEDEELVSISNTPSARNAINKNKTPQLNPERFAKTRVEEVGTSPRKAPVSGGATDKQLEVKPDGRVFGPPETSDPTQSSNGRRALDGSPLRSYEVVQFDPPVRYHTITSTEVLSAPSLLATPLGRLEAKAMVEVTAKMGLWLELRSIHGNKGYIYAQDAAALK